MELARITYYTKRYYTYVCMYIYIYIYIYITQHAIKSYTIQHYNIVCIHNTHNTHNTTILNHTRYSNNKHDTHTTHTITTTTTTNNNNNTNNKEHTTNDEAPQLHIRRRGRARGRRRRTRAGRPEVGMFLFDTMSDFNVPGSRPKKAR